MDSRFLSKSALWGIWGISLLLSGGCSDAVQLTRETESGGVVTYLYKEDRGGPMGSPHRKKALQMIDAKCPAGYFVIRDGEVTGTPVISGLEGQDSEGTGRRWGIQFRCK
ncbi:MAG TPA: hypothetical protein VJ746_06605 [Nitrospira sp.]|nr:hypothetical protein [Nitrospira sp.]